MSPTIEEQNKREECVRKNSRRPRREKGRTFESGKYVRLCKKEERGSVLEGD